MGPSVFTSLSFHLTPSFVVVIVVFVMHIVNYPDYIIPMNGSYVNSDRTVNSRHQKFPSPSNNNDVSSKLYMVIFDLDNVNINKKADEQTETM